MILIDLINEYASLIGLVAPPLCGWIWWSAKKSFAGKNEVTAMQTAQTAILARLESLEANVPDNQTMHKIELSLTELRGDMKAVCGRMDGMETSIVGLKNEISMLLEHHLENSR